MFPTSAHFTTGEFLSIELENDTLILRGNPEDSVGCVLRGSIVLTIFDEIKLRSLRGKLIGRARLCGNDNVSWREYVFVERRFQLLSAEGGPYHLKPNQYRYNFEIALEGNLPESVTLPNGKIGYKIYAVAERTGLHFDSRDKRTIKLRRSSDYTYSSVPVESSGNWDERLHYNIEIPQPSVIIGQPFPVSLNLTRTANDFDLVKIEFCLLETICCRTPGSTIDLQTKVHPMSEIKHDTIVEDNKQWRICPQLVLPPNVRWSLNTDYIQITHEIQVLFHIIDKHNEEKRVLESKFPIAIRSSIDQDASPPEYGSVTPATTNLESPPEYTSTSIQA
ncbi:hypothetical protein K7432_008811 [Basidiobolus ranarum]|uniref:Arrestin C-terminal-like domain-containing protein n=1 Tax=Basidiobolus ranarum TaxID=34480 RepID=A0ABR2VY24_9FUNG